MGYIKFRLLWYFTKYWMFSETKKSSFQKEISKILYIHSACQVSKSVIAIFVCT